MMRPLAALLATALVAPSRCFEVPGAVAALGAKYADSMAARPLLTKMGTSAAIFGASDASAQALERAPALDRTRLAVTTAIGGFYFAPAAHVWYGAITKAIPANDLRAILTKALLGQLIFGPLVTCVFFASARVPGRETKIVNTTSICMDSHGFDIVLSLSQKNSPRENDPSKHQPKRLRRDRAREV